MYWYGRDRHSISLIETHLTARDLVYLTEIEKPGRNHGNLAETGETAMVS